MTVTLLASGAVVRQDVPVADTLPTDYIGAVPELAFPTLLFVGAVVFVVLARLVWRDRERLFEREWWRWGRWNPGLVGFLLAVPGGAGFGGRSMEHAIAAQARVASDTLRFAHARHESISCTTCHTRGGRRGLAASSVARDCQGCHHGDSPTARDCVRCHATAEIAPVRQVDTPVALSVWPAPRTRTLGFPHDRHGALACTGCHAQTTARTVVNSCASCHADHHVAARDCTACHQSGRDSHTRELHATGCATSGCHVREASAAVAPVRATCLVCHAEQKAHKPGRECAPCHQSTWPVATAPGRP